MAESIDVPFQKWVLAQYLCLILNRFHDGGHAHHVSALEFRSFETQLVVFVRQEQILGRSNSVKRTEFENLFQIEARNLFQDALDIGTKKCAHHFDCLCVGGKINFGQFPIGKRDSGKTDRQILFVSKCAPKVDHHKPHHATFLFVKIDRIVNNSVPTMRMSKKTVRAHAHKRLRMEGCESHGAIDGRKRILNFVWTQSLCRPLPFSRCLLLLFISSLTSSPPSFVSKQVLAHFGADCCCCHRRSPIFRSSSDLFCLRCSTCLTLSTISQSPQLFSFLTTNMDKYRQRFFWSKKLVETQYQIVDLIDRKHSDESESDDEDGSDLKAIMKKIHNKALQGSMQQRLNKRTALTLQQLDQSLHRDMNSTISSYNDDTIKCELP